MPIPAIDAGKSRLGRITRWPAPRLPRPLARPCGYEVDLGLGEHGARQCETVLGGHLPFRGQQPPIPLPARALGPLQSPL